MFSIKAGRALLNGAAVPFKKSPNVGGALKPEYIVLHDTASGLSDDGPISWLTNPASKVSAHVVIGRDGKVTQLVPFNVKAWHAGQSTWRGRPLLNGFSIGIEIVNPGRLQRISDGVYKGVTTIDVGKRPELAVRRAKTTAHGDGYWLEYSPEQVAAVTDLCRAICAEYQIKEIVTHWLISPGRKVDTNPLFPLDAVRAACFSDAKPVSFASADSDESDPDVATTTATEEGPAADESAGGLGATWKLIQSKIAWASAGLGGLSIASVLEFLRDWRTLAVLGAILLVAYIVYERSKKP